MSLLALNAGGTDADLSGTGGTSKVLMQTSVGASITVGQLAASNLSNGTTGSGGVVLATSPVLTTPNIGAATVSGLNKVFYVDGVTYPLTAAGINSALSAAVTAGGGTVMLPPGTININAPITWSGVTVELIGAGRGVTILQMADPTNNLDGIVPSGASRIAHLTLKGTGSAGNANGITNGPIQDVTIEDIDISGFGEQLINAGSGSTNWIIKGCYIHEGLNEGILYGSANGGIISGNTIWGNANNGIDLAVC